LECVVIRYKIALRYLRKAISGFIPIPNHWSSFL
jgi:hypothetical protein